MTSKNTDLSLSQLEELAKKIADHHEGLTVEISYHISGKAFWHLCIYEESLLKFSLLSFAPKALEELFHIAEHGVDFTKQGTQL